MRIGFTIFLGLAMLCMSWSTASAAAADETETAEISMHLTSTFEDDLKPLLNAYSSLADERIKGVLRALRVAAVTDEARSGDWNSIKGLLAILQKDDTCAVSIWYVRRDGSYYTVEFGLSDKKLNDRPYFPVLMGGEDVIGSLQLSKSTGKRSAIVAVPIMKDGGAVGAVGASLSLDDMSAMLRDRIELPGNALFYALDSKGLCSLHTDPSKVFLFPSDQGSDTLKASVKDMLTNKEGCVRYEFHGKKTVIYKRSDFTNWTYAIGIKDAQ